MDNVFRLRPGDRGPQQQSPVSCGAACLVVGRMLRDPQVAQWVLRGYTGDRRSSEERFADLERRTMRRTNSPWGYPGRLQCPWPRELGTSPWGARSELEARSADPGTGYGTIVTRSFDRHTLARVFDEVIASVRPGTPALLFVGNDRLPRHICLFFAEEGSRSVLLYEPSSGQVDLPSRRDFITARLDLGGWHRAWFLIAPEHRALQATVRRKHILAPVPIPSTGPIMAREREDRAPLP